MIKTIFTALAALTSLTTAHFSIAYPKPRGFDEENLPQFPCGGQNEVSSTRTPWPITGGSIALEMGHITTQVEVLIAFGNNPGSAFNTIIRPTFTETGLGAFCMQDLTVPAGVNVTEGMNATIQVQTNGDPDGGLYNCADITFVSSVPAPEECKNGSVTITPASVSGHPNGTAIAEQGDSSEPSSSSTTSGGAAPSQTAKDGAAGMLNAGIGAFVMAAAAAFAIVL